MQYFYSTKHEGDRCFFDAVESKHMIRALRKKSGDRVAVLDGLGAISDCELIINEGELVEGKILKTIHHDPPKHRLHLAVAPTKSPSRLELLVEKGTEMGLAKITPILCDHSERVKLKPERMHKIALAASKQSGNPFLPQIGSIQRFAELIQSCGNSPGLKCIAYLSQEKELPLFTGPWAESEILLLIGPEGDFSKPEIEMAMASGFKGVSLGPLRLRTETAGIFACAQVYAGHQPRF